MNVMTSKVSLGMLARMEAEKFADARRLRRPPVTAPKMRVIILSRSFLFWGIEKAELRKKLRLGYINRNDVQDYSLFVREHIV